MNLTTKLTLLIWAAWIVMIIGAGVMLLNDINQLQQTIIQRSRGLK